MGRRVQRKGKHRSGEKKFLAIGSTAPRSTGGDDENPSAILSCQTFSLTCGPKSGGFVRWVWGLILVRIVSIVMDTYSIDYKFSNRLTFCGHPKT